MSTALRVAASFAAAAIAIGAATASAQAPTPAGGVMRASASPASENHRQIPAAAARALMAAHHPDVIDGSLDPAIVTLVLDLNNNYITSVASKPSVVVRTPDGSVAAAAGGFASAGTVVATPSAALASRSPTPSASVVIPGIGPIDASLVEETFWTNYAAGDVGPNAVRVRYFILKTAPR